MESYRSVISEKEILAISCPTCFRPADKLCVSRSNGMVLAFEVGATECSFHAARIMKAQDEQIKKLGLQPLGPTEKSLILYYAFIMLCDSVSEKSKELLGKQLTSEQVQAFFAHKAIEELKNDGLFKNGKTS